MQTQETNSENHIFKSSPEVSSPFWFLLAQNQMHPLWQMFQFYTMLQWHLGSLINTKALIDNEISQRKRLCREEGFVSKEIRGDLFPPPPPPSSPLDNIELLISADHSNRVHLLQEFERCAFNPIPMTEPHQSDQGVSSNTFKEEADESNPQKEEFPSELDIKAEPKEEEPSPLLSDAVELMDKIETKTEMKIELETGTSPLSLVETLDGSPCCIHKSKIDKKKIFQCVTKNFPGHIMVCLRKVLVYKRKEIHCVQKILEENGIAGKKLINVMRNYSNDWKTYKTICQFLEREGDKQAIKLLREMVAALLDDQNENEFQEWIQGSRMTTQTKDLFRENRAKVRTAFLDRLKSLD